MSKKLYALTDEQAKWLGYYARIGGYPSLDDTLTPMDRNAAVERMADALKQLDGFDYEDIACAALGALLQKEKK